MEQKNIKQKHREYMNQKLEAMRQMSSQELKEYILEAVAYCKKHNLITPEEMLNLKKVNGDPKARVVNKMHYHQFLQENRP